MSPNRSRGLRIIAASSAIGLGAAALVAITPAAAAPAVPNNPNPDAAAPTEPAPATASGLIIKYRDDVVLAFGEDAPVPGQADTEIELVNPVAINSHTSAVDFATPQTPEALAAAIADLQANPMVAEVAVETIAFPMATQPNDPLFNSQWGFSSFGDSNFINREDEILGGQTTGTNWQEAVAAVQGETPVVAVIDTGITNHPDLTGALVPGFDFISNVARANDGDARDPNPADTGDWMSETEMVELPFSSWGCSTSNSSWHGTHVTGTIAEVTNNNLGGVGSYPLKVQTVRALGKCGGNAGDIAAAITWAAGGDVPGVPRNQTPAKVINMSLGGTMPDGTCPFYYQDAINFANSQGTTVVVAAGNSNIDAQQASPANCDGVVTVAATDYTGSRASFSNFGDKVDIAAPGVGILSTLNTGTRGPAAPDYKFYNGTSMATPHVAGAAAMLLTNFPTMTPHAVEAALVGSATRFKASAKNNDSFYDCVGVDSCGAGILNTAALLGADFGTPPPVEARYELSETEDPDVWMLGLKFQPGSEPAPTGVVYEVVLADGDEAFAIETSSTEVSQTIPSSLDTENLVVTVQPFVGDKPGVMTQAMLVDSLEPSVPNAPAFSVYGFDSGVFVETSSPYVIPQITSVEFTAQPGGQSCLATPSGSQLSCMISGLENGEQYSITGVATNPLGSSGVSEPQVVTPDALTPILPAGKPEVVVGERNIEVNWSPAVANPNNSIVRYKVVVPENPQAKCYVYIPDGQSEPPTHCSMTNLLVGQESTVVVQASDFAGNIVESVPSDPFTVTGPAVPPTSIITAPKVVAGDGLIQVREILLEEVVNGGAPILGYRAVASPGGRGCEVVAQGCDIVGLTNGQRYTVSVYAYNEMGAAEPSDPSPVVTPTAADTTGTLFVPVTPTRAFDSRTSSALQPQESVVVDLSESGLIPEQATAVTYTLTVTNPGSGGFISVRPGDATGVPETSTINWSQANTLLANSFVSKLDQAGQVQLYLGGATAAAHAVVDVTGYYIDPALTGSGSGFISQDPARAYDSRANNEPLLSGQTRQVAIDPTLVPSNATALAYTLTVTDTAGQGFLSVNPAGIASTTSSTINWGSDAQTLANSSVVMLGAPNEITVSAGGGGQTQFIVDVLGYYTTPVNDARGAQFFPIDPRRDYDSRENGLWLTSGSMRTNNLPSIPSSATAAAINLTETETLGSGFLNLIPTPQAPSGTSTINWYESGTTRANGTSVAVSNQQVTTAAGGNGRTQYLLDIAGYFK